MLTLENLPRYNCPCRHKHVIFTCVNGYTTLLAVNKRWSVRTPKRTVARGCLSDYVPYMGIWVAKSWRHYKVGSFCGGFCKRLSPFSIRSTERHSINQYIVQNIFWQTFRLLLNIERATMCIDSSHIWNIDWSRPQWHFEADRFSLLITDFTNPMSVITFILIKQYYARILHC